MIFSENGRESNMNSLLNRDTDDLLAGIPMEIDVLFKRLYEYRKSLIGSSHYYIKVEQGCSTLCRLIHGGGGLYFSEIVNHEKYGISDKDIDEAVTLNCHILCLADHYHISPHIEKKLRALLDFS